MEKNGSSSKQHNLFYAATLLAPVTHSASGITWPVAVILSAASMLLGNLARWGTGWILTVQKIWAAVLAGVFMQWSALYWEGLPYGGATPLFLLALVVWTLSVPGKAGRIGCVLIWPLVLLLGAVLLSGIKEMEIGHLRPTRQTSNWFLLAILLIPTIQGRWTRGKLALAAIAISIIASSVLSPKVSTEVDSGIYELSRSLSLLGVAERFESLIAAAMTLGFYTSMTYLLEGEERKQVWGDAAISALAYITALPVSGWIMAAGAVLFWVILPRFHAGKIISENGKKGIDKS